MSDSLNQPTPPITLFDSALPPDQLSQLIQVGNQVIPAAEVLPLLTRYRLLPQFLREMTLDQAITPFTCTSEEVLNAVKQFYAQQQISSDVELQMWLSRNYLTLGQLEEIITRALKIEKFKHATWDNKIETYFLQRKGQLDRVVYSLIRLQDEHLAQELFFRIQAGEQSLAELARQYSNGPEAQTGGLMGPIELGKPHPVLAQKLAASQPGQLLPPMRLEDWIVIVRLEKFLPCQFDEMMHQRLLNELFETWITEKIRPVGQ